MNLKLIYRNVLVMLGLFALVSCDNQWDDHVEINDERENQTIMQIISSDSETSVFASIVEKAGYSELLSGSQMLTVFVPQNSALQSIDTEDVDKLKELVKNHISFASYSVINNVFELDTVTAINGKKLIVSGKTIDKVGISEENIAASNGMIHIMQSVITPKKNIWEYLKTEKIGYPQIEFLNSLTEEVMDPDKSVQIGIDENGNPIYDIVPMDVNPILDEYPLNSEDYRYTFVLLEEAPMNAIETKYSKYFVRIDQNETDSVVRMEFIKDCILIPVDNLTAGNTYTSIDGVNIQIGNIESSYEASNGMVYIVSEADIKIYENKLKTIIIEAEDYSSYYSDANAWFMRSRPDWASGGYDMMLSSYTRNFAQRMLVDDDGELTGEEKTVTYRYYYTQQAGYRSTLNNNYIMYKHNLNSVGYTMYGRAYDDIESHYIHDKSDFADDTLWTPMVYTQKLLISFPDEEPLELNSERLIENNFINNSAFAMRGTAGVLAEWEFFRYRATATNDGIFFIRNEYDDDFEDEFGTNSIIMCPRYGEATIMVANTVVNDETNENGGMIFLDYLKFVPDVDEND